MKTSTNIMPLPQRWRVTRNACLGDPEFLEIMVKQGDDILVFPSVIPEHAFIQNELYGDIYEHTRIYLNAIAQPL